MVKVTLDAAKTNANVIARNRFCGSLTGVFIRQRIYNNVGIFFGNGIGNGVYKTQHSAGRATLFGINSGASLAGAIFLFVGLRNRNNIGVGFFCKSRA